MGQEALGLGFLIEKKGPGCWHQEQRKQFFLNPHGTVVMAASALGFGPFVHSRARAVKLWDVE